MTLRVEIDRQLLAKAAQKFGLDDESAVLNQALASVVGETDLPTDALASEAWWREIGQIDFPDLSESEWEAWKSQGRQALPDAW